MEHGVEVGEVHESVDVRDHLDVGVIPVAGRYLGVGEGGVRIAEVAVWLQGEFQINMWQWWRRSYWLRLPLLMVYVAACRQLVSGMTAGFSK
ncbi:hypothetical protein AB0H92_11985 [Streptomyces phaeochromogenes]|uniref:hypothetical protein n=1 Tax=Streptomyces phaeochromogenes TaxID=1923 RepID=UPI0033D38A50